MFDRNRSSNPGGPEWQVQEVAEEGGGKHLIPLEA